MTTDKLRSHEAVQRASMPFVVHDTERWANNRAEVLHEPADSVSDKCEDSNPPLKHNDSGLCTELSRILSESDATCCG